MVSRRKLTFWALLIGAVLALSQFLTSWRVWRAAPSPDHAAAVVVLGLGLLAAVGWLGFLLYEVDRSAGRIRREVGVYEWVIARRRQEAAGWRPEVPRQTGQEAAGWRPEVPREKGGAGR